MLFHFHHQIDYYLLSSSSITYAWDTLYAEIIEDIEFHQDNVSDVQVSPNGRVIATCSWDGNIAIFSK